METDTNVVEQTEGAPDRTCAKCGATATHEGNHCVCGSLLPGSVIALKHGLHSQRVQNALLPEQAEARAVLAEKRAEIETDLGGTEQLSALSRGLVKRYVELDTVADHVIEKIIRDGLFTAKGRPRAAMSAYVSLVDRLQRLAVTLGLQRRLKPVSPLDAVRAAVAEANKK